MAVSHRSTIKKDKKAFKSKHATKGQIKARNQGKVEKSRPSANSKKNSAANKLQRKNLAKQLKEKKIENAIEHRKLFQSNNGIEKIVTVVSLTDDVNEGVVINKIIEHGTSSESVSQTDDIMVEDPKSGSKNIINTKFTKFKSSFKFIQPNKDKFLSILDAARISDFVIFCLSANQEVDPSYGEQIIRAVELQGISQTICVVCNMNQTNSKDKQQKHIMSSLTSYFKHFFPNDDKLYNIDSFSDLSKVVHVLSSTVPRGINWLNKRGYLVADNVAMQNENILAVQGTIRGSGFYINQLVNIPNVGQFSIKKIEVLNKKNEVDQVITDEKIVENENDDLDTLTLEEEEDDDMEFEDEDFDEQLMEEDDNDFIDTETPPFLDPEDADYDQEIEDVLSGKNQISAGNNLPDIELTKDDEQRQLDLFLEESENPGTTEELHLDPRQSAVERLRRYKFSLNEIDNNDEFDEDTPEEFKKMFRIKNFKIASNRAFKIYSKKLQVKLGAKVNIYLEIPGEELSEALNRFNQLDSFENTPFAVFGLLKNEDKKSLCNFSIKSWEAYEKPISSKDEIIVQYGSRRQIIKPLYSVNSNNKDNLHKYLRFSLSDTTNIASTIVPINYGRLPVLFFKTNSGSGEYPRKLELIGSGSFESIDHTRTTVKRILLVGQPFKIHKKVITIRYMFFNPGDIAFFRSVPLFTKSGASGYIKESLGTHGYFKATFNKKLSAQDYVYMALYKKLWPKDSRDFIEAESS